MNREWKHKKFTESSTRAREEKERTLKRRRRWRRKKKEKRMGKSKIRENEMRKKSPCISHIHDECRKCRLIIYHKTPKKEGIYIHSMSRVCHFRGLENGNEHDANVKIKLLPFRRSIYQEQSKFLLSGRFFYVRFLCAIPPLYIQHSTI